MTTFVPNATGAAALPPRQTRRLRTIFYLVTLLPTVVVTIVILAAPEGRNWLGHYMRPIHERSLSAAVDEAHYDLLAAYIFAIAAPTLVAISVCSLHKRFNRGLFWLGCMAFPAAITATAVYSHYRS